MPIHIIISIHIQEEIVQGRVGITLGSLHGCLYLLLSFVLNALKKKRKNKIFNEGKQNVKLWVLQILLLLSAHNFKKNVRFDIKSNNINEAIVNCLIWNLNELLQTHKINIQTRESVLL